MQLKPAIFSGICAVALLCCPVPGGLYPARAAGALPCAENESIIFGFLPLVSAEKLVQRFGPLVQYLEMHLKVPVRIETAPDFHEFLYRTSRVRRYDLLFTAPHFFYRARHEQGYRLLASVDSPGMAAVIVVPDDSAIRTLQDLVGKRLATVDPMALATLLTRQYLLENAIDPERDLMLVATPSHNASLLSARIGVTDAASLMTPPYMAASPEVRNSMRVIATTGTSPHMPVSAAPWISEACMAQLSEVLVGMRSTDAGRRALLRAEFPGFVRTDAALYDSMEWAAQLLDTP